MKRNTKPRTARQSSDFTKKFADGRQKSKSWRRAALLRWKNRQIKEIDPTKADGFIKPNLFNNFINRSRRGK